MSYTQAERNYEHTPNRVTYKNDYQKRTYKQVGFYKLVESGAFKTIDGRTVKLTQQDKLYFPKGHRRWFDCPSHGIKGILIPTILTVRRHDVVRK